MPEIGARFVVHSVLFVAAVGYFANTIYGRVRVLQSVAWTDLFDKIPERINKLVVYGFGQKKFVVDRQDPAPSWMHFFIFWGFVILGLRVVTAFGQGWFGLEFHLPLMGADMLGGPYLLLKDLMEVVVVCSVAFALVRWLFIHPKRLYGFEPAEARLAGQSHGEAILILCFIAGIMLTDLFFEAGRFIYAAGDPAVEAERSWVPVASMLSTLIQPIGAENARIVSEIGWWGHNIIIMIFMNLLPLSKHFHIITGLPNVFFSKLEPLGALSKQESRDGRDLRDVAHRPVHLEAGPRHVHLHRVRALLVELSGDGDREAAGAAPDAAESARLPLRAPGRGDREACGGANGANGEAAERPRGRGENIVGDDSVVHDDVHLELQHVPRVRGGVSGEHRVRRQDRRHAPAPRAGGSALSRAELTRVFKGLETQSNPWGIGAEKRDDWAEDLDIPTHRRQARRGVPLLRRVRGSVRRSQQEDDRLLRQDPA